MTPAILRFIAIAIAVAGLIDPAIIMSGATRARLAVVTTGPSSPAAATARDRVVQSLASSFDIVSNMTSDSAAAVFIGDRYPDEPVPENLPVATISVADEVTPSVRVVAVDAPREVPPNTSIHLDVVTEGAGLAGTSSDITARIGGLEVARVSHRWTASRERWRASIDAVPVGNPPWVVQTGVVSASPRTVDTVVDLRRTPLRVTFYEPRPSWATTFIRRALEADGRFEVAGVSFSSRGIAARTGDAVSLSDERIDAADVIVVGGLDRLSAIDVRSLERFMRERGGAVVLAPDARLDTRPARDLVGSARVFTERLLERPAALSMSAGLAPLEASELLVPGALTPDVDVIAETGGADAAPVIVSMPRGSGRLFISGAMDAWRFRAAGTGAFDRFWRSAIAGLAQAAPPPVDVTVEPPLLRPLERGTVIVRVRSREYAPLVAAIDDDPIRLRPDPEAGVFRGTFTAKGDAGRSTIDIRPAAGQPPVASRTVLVRGDARLHGVAAPLAMLAASHHGVDVTPDRIADLERFLRASVTAPQTAVVRRPMRSGWWIAPFVGCLSIEWWLRRRRGLR